MFLAKLTEICMRLWTSGACATQSLKKVSLIRSVRIHSWRPMANVKMASTTIRKTAAFSQLRLLVARAGRVQAKAMNVKMPLPMPADF